jgi:hypothetical protein
MVKTDASGWQEWQQSYGGFKEDRGFAVQSTADGGYLIGGTTESFGNGKVDCYVIKTNPVGDAQWTNTYGGSQSDYCSGLVVEQGSFCLIGHSYSYTAGGSDVYVVKAESDQSTPVDDDLFPDLPMAYHLEQNYPNPFNATTRIQFTLAHRGTVHLSIYNILGQHIRSWQFDHADAGTTMITWDGTDALGRSVASGVYFYRLESDMFVETRKMILLK